ncbi:unnamed protein product, partial [Larinioides sclopetarius]
VEKNILWVLLFKGFKINLNFTRQNETSRCLYYFEGNCIPFTSFINIQDKDSKLKYVQQNLCIMFCIRHRL